MLKRKDGWGCRGVRGCVVGDVELDDRVSRHNDGAMLLDVWCGGADAGVAGVGHHRVRGACAWRGGADVVEELHEVVVVGAASRCWTPPRTRCPRLAWWR